MDRSRGENIDLGHWPWTTEAFPGQLDLNSCTKKQQCISQVWYTLASDNLISWSSGRTLSILGDDWSGDISPQGVGSHCPPSSSFDAGRCMNIKIKSCSGLVLVDKMSLPCRLFKWPADNPAFVTGYWKISVCSWLLEHGLFILAFVYTDSLDVSFSVGHKNDFNTHLIADSLSCLDKNILAQQNNRRPRTQSCGCLQSWMYLK